MYDLVLSPSIIYGSDTIPKKKEKSEKMYIDYMIKFTPVRSKEEVMHMPAIPKDETPELREIVTKEVRDNGSPIHGSNQQSTQQPLFCQT